MVHITWFLFKIWFLRQSFLWEALSLIESRMIRTQHAHIWLPIVVVLIVLHFDDALVHLSRGLEALEQIASLIHNTRHLLLSRSVHLLLWHHLSAIFLHVFCIFIFNFSHILWSLSRLNECHIVGAHHLSYFIYAAVITLLCNLRRALIIWLFFLLGENLLVVEIIPIFVCIHALDSVLLKCWFVLTVLDKAGHGLVTNRVELNFHEIVDVGEGFCQFFILTCHILLYLVAEGADKAKVVFELDDEGLIVYCLPPAAYWFFITMTRIAALTEFGFNREVGLDHDRPCVLFTHRKTKVFINYLHFIRQAMRAHLFLLKQVEIYRLGCHMEQPDLIVKLLSQAAHWLVCAAKLH